MESLILRKSLRLAAAAWLVHAAAGHGGGASRTDALHTAHPRRLCVRGAPLLSPPLLVPLRLALRLNVTATKWQEREGSDATEARAEEY